MHKVFVICEFNPFHWGHEYILSCAKRDFPDSCLICVMGGCFSQRGEAYIYDKYSRAACAVDGGADIVLLLPTIYSSSASRSFALAAIRICNSLAAEGDVLYFGSECGDTGALRDCISKLNSLSVSSSPDDSFIRTRFASYEKAYGDASILSHPNNILGIEYLRAIDFTHSPLIPHTLKRESKFASAATIRTYEDDNFFASLPDYCIKHYSSVPRADMASGERYVLGVLRSLSPDLSAKYSECGGGVSNRIISSAKRCTTYGDLIQASSTKRYTNSHLRRAVLALLMRISHDERFSEPTFTVLLAAKRNSLGVLNSACINIVTKPSSCTDPNFLRELEFDDLYSLFTQNVLPQGYSLKFSPYICNT